ncbi:MAG: hypothetical protein LAO08_05680 [Acidobacteriia bacterium]|nr:hypothetical protein [Terriglobia bacterium]
MLRGRSDAGLRHPGTRDVDVLFNDDRETIRNAVQLFLASGFVLSAKHEFQLLKALSVGSRKFVFNIDLMHPAEAFTQPEMFQDIMDLGIRSDYDEMKPKVKSICFRSSAIIFQQNLWSRVKVAATNFSGKHSECYVPLMDESALILSKADSVKQDKRARDAFDIYFLLSGPEGQKIAKKLKSLSASFPQVSMQLEHLHKFLKEHSNQFDKNVANYFTHKSVAVEPSRYVRELLFS